ncbi:acetyltransferase [Colletotrichum truncatum]|uniref:Acetyltransferase n=1 Tax=Colletotrichum truncatum TaxID=5467 RepID=A0ACC3YMS4_COLTU|nr:acetyltransferase [Colletotrichum truncatum]KAF6792151.1 acetyltransferase [Colletotrichum truncatum]
MPTQASHLPTLLRSPTHPILLRTLEPRDAASVSAVLSDPENTKYDPHASAVSPEVAVKVIERMRESASAPTVLDDDDAGLKVVRGPGRVNLLIVYVDGVEDTLGSTADDGTVIGFGGFGNIQELDEDGEKVRVGDVGAMINSAFRGRGLATEAIRLAVEWAFKGVREGGLQLARVTATMSDKNVAMVGLVEKKLGWTGVRKPNGEVFFEVTKDTWRK